MKSENTENQDSLKRGALYVVGLPIGNPKDITVRAMEVLAQVDGIAAEDTRVFQELCGLLKIQPKKVFSHHEHNAKESSIELQKMLKAGLTLALVSDAGTPRLSDPGFDLVQAAHQIGSPVIPIPGVSALSTVLSVSPLGGPPGHIFLGFLSSLKQEREEELRKIKNSPLPIVFFESPHRVLAFFDSALEVLGDRMCFVGREMTKTFEEYKVNRLSEWVKPDSLKNIKGEFTLIIEGNTDKEDLTLEDLKAIATEMLDQGTTAKDTLARIRELSDLPKRTLFLLVEEIKKNLKS
jgi:16S rRNA (cytidine1402-2'-O)-methyltransferase